MDHWQAREGLEQSTVQAIAQTPEGYLWLGTRNGLVRFDGVRFQVFSLLTTPELVHENISDLTVTPDGALWVGMSQGGLLKYSRGKFTRLTKSDGLGGEAIRSLLVDGDGSLWVGTFGAGVTHLKDGKARVYNTSHGMASNTVRAMARAAGGGVWVGTDLGLYKISGGVVAPVPASLGLNGKMVVAVHQDASGELWVGADKTGLVRIRDGESKTLTVADGLCSITVRSIRRDRDGNLWVATSGGLNRITYRGIESFTQKDGLTHSYVRLTFEDLEGALWLGLFGGGLDRLKDSKFVNYTAAEGLPDEYVFTVLETKDGSVWMGTEKGGLARLKEERIQVFRKEDGLPSNSVWALTEGRDETLWIGTGAGGISTLRGGRIKTFRPEDGLPRCNAQHILQKRDGSVWAATSEGLAEFRDDKWVMHTVAEKEQTLRAVLVLAETPDGRLLASTNAALYEFRDGRLQPSPLLGNRKAIKVHSMYFDSRGTLWAGTDGEGLLRAQGGQVFAFSMANGLPNNVVYRAMEDGKGDLWITTNSGVVRARRAAMDAFAGGGGPAVEFKQYGVADGMRSRECNGGGGGQPAGWVARDGRVWIPTVKGVSVIDPANLRINARPPAVMVESVQSGREEWLRSGVAELPAGSRRIEVRYSALSLLAPERNRIQYRLGGVDGNWVDAGGGRVASYTQLSPGEYVFRVRACNNDGVWNESGASVSIRIEPYFYETVWFAACCAGAAFALLAWLARLRDRWVRRSEAAEALKRANVELEARVEERTSALARANEDLRQEIADRMKAEEELRLTQRSIDQTAVATLWFDARGGILRANQAACRLFGQNEREILTLDASILDYDAGEELWPALWADLKRDGSKTTECMSRRNGGEPRPLEVRATLIKFEGREFALCVVQDVSERQQLEARVRDIQKMEAVGQLAGGVAHDFNNLLTVILGHASMAAPRAQEGSAVRESLGEIQSAGERAAALVSQLLAFGRKQHLRLRVLKLCEVVDGQISMLRSVVGERVALNVRHEPEVEPVEADQHQLERVILNLVMNARDAMPKGGTLGITTTAEEVPADAEGNDHDIPAGRYSVLSVTDTGCGMSPATQAHLFEPFFTTKELGRGTGLGLSTVYGIVRQLGGSVSVKSEEGRGSEIKVYLPVSRAAASEAAQPPARDAKQRGANSGVVLVVEDEPGVRALISSVLRESGFEVVAAEDGESALEASSGRIDAVVTDVVMPGMSGTVLANRLRQIHPAVPVLFVSGYSHDERSGSLTKLPGTAYLQKPFSPQHLVEILRGLLDSAPPQGRW
ncbi:MAG: response regulator [Candidatus Solibacter usitatus]|nr:response regulator [Candidatus Solibacter usitatus]